MGGAARRAKRATTTTTVKAVASWSTRASGAGAARSLAAAKMLIILAGATMLSERVRLARKSSEAKADHVLLPKISHDAVDRSSADTAVAATARQRPEKARTNGLWFVCCGFFSC